MQPANWNGCLLAIMRGQTLTSAARQLRVDDTTVSRRLVAPAGSPANATCAGASRQQDVADSGRSKRWRVMRSHCRGDRLAGTSALLRGQPGLSLELPDSEAHPPRSGHR